MADGPIVGQVRSVNVGAPRRIHWHGREVTTAIWKYPVSGRQAVRGVNIDGVLQTLMERGLVKIAGRAEVPGRPLLYETTQFFLDHFGLRNLDELPNAEELRKRDLPISRSVAGMRDAGQEGASASAKSTPETSTPAITPQGRGD